MKHTAVLSAAFAAIALGCGLSGPPTPVPIPRDATDVSHIVVSVGTPRGYRTEFTLQVDFPASPVPELYAKALQAPWTQCDWSPEWRTFVDTKTNPARTVHQQLHFWFNRDAARTLELLTRYYSAGNSARKPDDNKQRVVVTELLGQNVDERISKLGANCPAKELRSNSTPHSDARRASSQDQPSSARAGERGR